MSTCSACGPRSRRTPSTRRSLSRFAAWGTRPVLADLGMERSAVTQDAAGQPGAARESGPPREYRREAWEMAMRRNRVVRWLVSWLPHRVTITLRAVLRWQHSIVVKGRQRWNRSLQLRVIGTTLVISTSMIAILGFFLTEQIAQGLLANAESTAHSQALAGLNAASSLPGLTVQPASNSAAQSFLLSRA